jgi:hypothetical protein
MIIKYCILFIQVVNQLSPDLLEETKEYIKKEINNEEKENIKLWGDHIQCNYIPYQRQKKPLAKLTNKPATESAFVTDFSMKYTTEKKEISAPVKTPKPTSSKVI